MKKQISTEGDTMLEFAIKDSVDGGDTLDEHKWSVIVNGQPDKAKSYLTAPCWRPRSIIARAWRDA